MTQDLKQFQQAKKIRIFRIYLIIELIIVILSIIIPYNIIILIHAYYGCGHHSGGIDGDLGEWGKSYEKDRLQTISNNSLGYDCVNYYSNHPYSLHKYRNLDNNRL